MDTKFTHTPAPGGYDSRIYDTMRRKSLSGYFELPVVDDTLSLILPPFSPVHSWIVTTHNKTWLLWSPNSLVEAYYPGIRAPGHEVKMVEDRTKRHFDSHLGRFDPTKSPQHYNLLQPWLPFVKREQAHVASIENAPLAIAWVSSLPRREMKDLGRLDTALLIQLTTRNIEVEAAISTMTTIADIKQEYWDDRPRYPSESEIRGLGGEHHYADAVDLVTQIQRGLKLKDAWLRTMSIVKREHREAVIKEWIMETPFAMDDVLGTWINGAKEEHVYWLLKHRIPCFIFHEVSITELYNYKEDHKHQDFVASTDIQYLVPKTNAYNHVAYKKQATFNNDRDREGIPAGYPTLSAGDHVNSDPATQGWDGVKHKRLEELQEVVMRPVEPNRRPESTTRSSRAPSSSRTYDDQELEVRSLASDRVDWIVPPAVMAVSDGKWTFWKECDIAQDGYYFCLVSPRPDDCERVCYNRQRRREIFFLEGMETPASTVSDLEKFRFPAPLAWFVEMKEEEITKEHPASCWIYTKKTASKGTVGQRAPTPSAMELPLKKLSVKGTEKIVYAPVIHHPPSPSILHRPSSGPLPKPSITVMPQPVPARPIPTEPRSYRLQLHLPQDQETQDARHQLGHRPRAPSSSSEHPAASDRGHAKKIKSSDGVKPPMFDVSNPNPKKLATPLPAVIARIELSASQTFESNRPLSVIQANFSTLGSHSSDSRFLCFEGLPPDWETCHIWFYSMAVSSHFVWINRLFWMVVHGVSLISVDMRSNDDACTLRGYLTHRTMADGSLVISHFITENVFIEATRNTTDSWTRPPLVVSTGNDDPMDGPGPSSIPLKERLTSPGSPNPAPDVSLFHRAAVTLEERVEHHPQGGQKHRKYKAKQQQKP